MTLSSSWITAFFFLSTHHQACGTLQLEYARGIKFNFKLLAGQLVVDEQVFNAQTLPHKNQVTCVRTIACTSEKKTTANFADGTPSVRITKHARTTMPWRNSLGKFNLACLFFDYYYCSLIISFFSPKNQVNWVKTCVKCVVSFSSFVI